jgi:outer membrane protein assembly factor BamB
MSRGRWAMALIATTLVGPLVLLPTAAQETAEVHVFLNRVKLADNDRDEFEDPFDADADQPATIAGQIALAAAPRVSLAFETALSGAAAWHAAERYERILEQYRQQMADEELRLIRPPLAHLRPTLGVSNRDAHAQVQDWMRRLPPAILARYQDRIDADAQRLLDAGLAKRDAARLRQIATDYAASRQADVALGQLGDLAFERGEFDLALNWWRRIAPLPSQELALRRGLGEGRRRPGVDLVRVHAKQVLALAFAGRTDAGHERDAFRSLYPSASGNLAGQSDAYHEILTHWIERLKEAAPAGDENWPTLGGAANRSRIERRSLNPRLWLDGPAWTSPLPAIDAGAPSRVWLSATRSLTPPSLPVHPIIASGQVLVNDGHAVTAHDLHTGKKRFRVNNGQHLHFRDNIKPIAERAFTLSAGRGRAFACLGDHPGDPQPRKLVAIDLTGERTIEPMIWTVSASVAEHFDVWFDSDPLVVGDRVYVGVMAVGKSSAVRELACFNISGTHLWQTRLAEFPMRPDWQPNRPSLLVGTGTAIVSTTHAGAIVAVDSMTGRRMWAFRYPGVAGASPRGAVSSLAVDGRVFAAPADSAHLYCLDAETGSAIWDRPWSKRPGDIITGPPTPSDIVELFGVVDGRLLVADRGGVTALDAGTGWSLEWRQPVQGKLPGLGRGLLAGPWFFWPTADPDVAWRAVGAADGGLRQIGTVPEYYELTMLRNLPAGNAAFGEGCLVIAGERELTAFVPAAKHIPLIEKTPEARKTPISLYKIALHHLDAGRETLANDVLAELKSRVSASEFDAWNHLLHERTAPPATRSVTQKPALRPAVAKPENSVYAASFSTIKPAWGPTPGICPPVESLGRANDDLTFVLDGGDIAVLSSRDGKERFRQPLRHRGVQWIGRDDRIVIVAGRDGIEAFDLTSQAAAWHVDSNAVMHRRWQLIDGKPMLPIVTSGLDSFQFLGSALLYRDDKRSLIALDPQTGRRLAERTVDDVHAMVGGAAIPPASDWTIPGADAGRIIDASLAAWNAEPEELSLAESRRRLLRLNDAWRIRGETHGRVRLTGLRGDPATDSIYQPAWPTSLTGAPAHVFGDESVCFALIPRNQGFELTSLEPRPGLRPLWSLPATELREGFDVLTAAWDQSAVYFVHAGQLQARSLTNGSLLWRFRLPKTSGTWHVEAWGGKLLVWPQSTSGIPAVLGPGDPRTAALALLTGRRGIGGVPVLLVDPKTGTQLDRVEVPHASGPVFVNRQVNQILVTADGKTRAFAGMP